VFYVVIIGMLERAVINYGRFEIIKKWGKISEMDENL
jgi:hypothetical protein